MSGMPLEAGDGQTRPRMAEESSLPGKSSIFPAIKGESKTPGAYREAGSGSEEAEKMKCTYCDGFDHLETRCPSRAGDRRKEIGLSLIVFVVSFIPYIIGFMGGIWWSALRTGFSFTKDFWPEAWATIRGKKGEDGESGSV
jgi:hypothetical protein